MFVLSYFSMCFLLVLKLNCCAVWFKQLIQPILWWMLDLLKIVKIYVSRVLIDVQKMLQFFCKNLSINF